MRSYVPAIPIGIGAAFAAAVWSRLPAEIPLDMSHLFPFNVSAGDPLPRAAVALGLPLLALVTWWLMEFFASRAGERAGSKLLPEWAVSERTGAAAIDRFEPTFTVIVTAVVSLLILIEVLLLGGALDWPHWLVPAFTTAIGLELIILGNVMPRIRPNWVAGIRTKRTLTNPDTWRRVHRRFGATLLLTGVAMVATSWIAGSHALLVGIIGFVVAGINAEIAARTAG